MQGAAGRRGGRVRAVSRVYARLRVYVSSLRTMCLRAAPCAVPVSSVRVSPRGGRVRAVSRVYVCRRVDVSTVYVPRTCAARCLAALCAVPVSSVAALFLPSSIFFVLFALCGIGVSNCARASPPRVAVCRVRICVCRALRLVPPPGLLYIIHFNLILILFVIKIINVNVINV